MQPVLLSAAVPVATIITRHSADCPYLGDENYKRCKCWKSIRWFEKGKQRYKTTKSRTWEGAERFKRNWEASRQPHHSTQPVRIVTVRDAVDAFLDQKRGQGISHGVIKKFERELGRLVAFADEKQRHTVQQISLHDLSEFRAGWDKVYPSSGTRTAVQSRLREFFKYCVNADLIHKNAASGLSAIKTDRPPTMPLTADEYVNLLATIPNVFPDSRKQRRVRSLVQCMRYSGLAIHDAVGLQRTHIHKIKRPEREDVWVVVTAREKTGTDVFVPIKDDVAAEIIDTPNDHDGYFFWNTGLGTVRTAVVHWQHDLRALFRASGLPTGHPHQLRDTFACEMLASGVPLESVSKMLGHSSVKITEKHYAPWVKIRQDQLISVVTATWRDKKPEPTLTFKVGDAFRCSECGKPICVAKTAELISRFTNHVERQHPA